MRLLEVGEIVEYYSRRYDPEPSHVGKVLESLPKGIPSYPYPMVKLEGKAGYLSAEHCMPARATRNPVEPFIAEACGATNGCDCGACQMKRRHSGGENKDG